MAVPLLLQGHHGKARAKHSAGNSGNDLLLWLAHRRRTRDDFSHLVTHEIGAKELAAETLLSFPFPRPQLPSFGVLPLLLRRVRVAHLDTDYAADVAPASPLLQLLRRGQGRKRTNRKTEAVPGIGDAKRAGNAQFHVLL